MREICHDARTERISGDCKYDRDGSCRFFYYSNGPTVGNNYINLLLYEFRCELGDALWASLRPPVFDCDGPTLNPAELPQTVFKSSNPRTPRLAGVALSKVCANSVVKISYLL